MGDPRILIAGVGNIFLGDDAFGVEVAQRLRGRRLPDNVSVIDFGIRGLDLTYALLGGYDAAILVDAAPRGGPPGTLYVVDIEVDETTSAGDLTVDAHDLDPVKVLRLAAALGNPVKRILLVGCEPAPMSEKEMSMGISDRVRTAVEAAIPLIESLVTKLRSEKNDFSAVSV
jgi:hydrogenase maturation protease